VGPHLAQVTLSAAAVGLWTGLLVALGRAPVPGGLTGDATVGLGLCLLALLLLGRARSGSTAAGEALPRRALLLIVVTAVGCGLLLGGLALRGLHPEWWTTILARRAWVEATVTVRQPPALRAPPPGAEPWQQQHRQWWGPAHLTGACLPVDAGERTCWSGPGLPILLLTEDPAAAHWRTGEQLTVAGIVGPATWRPDLAGVLAVRTWAATDGPPGWQRLAGAVRASLQRACTPLPEASRALIPGLAVGDRGAGTATLAEAMRTAGLSHLTAVSGGNFALVIAGVLLLGRLGGLRGRALPVLGLLSLLGYAAVTGPEPSVLRAGVMGAIGLIGVLLERRSLATTSLPAATLLLLLHDPWLARSWGFTLSVLATAGLIWGAPVLREIATRLIPRAPTVIAGVVVVALTAHLVTLPVIAGFTGEVSLVGVLANVLVAPVIAWVTLLGVAAAVLGLASPLLGQWAAAAASPGAEWIGIVARWAAGLPGAHLAVPRGAGGFLLGLLLSGAVMWALRAASRRIRPARPRRGPAPVRRLATLMVAVAVLLIAVLLAFPRGASVPPGEWVVAFCDVGQGDATAVQVGPGAAIVIDVGPDPRPIDRCLRDLGIVEIPLLVLTHFHADHVDGLPGALRRRAVGTVLISPLAEPAPAAARVRGSLTRVGVTAETAEVGQRWQVGPATVDVLWPPRLDDPRTQAVRGQGSDPNNLSVIVLIEVRADADRADADRADVDRADADRADADRVGTATDDEGDPVRVLLTGDLEAAAQSVLIAADPPPGVDVVKVPHHGSPNQHPDFATWAGAPAAVVSVGADNDYGHPAPATLAAYGGQGASLPGAARRLLTGPAIAGPPLLRTDEVGTILVDPQGRLRSQRP